MRNKERETPAATGRLDVSAGFSIIGSNHAKAFAKHSNHINGIENFWSQTKRHLFACRKIYNGIPKEHFELYLKECPKFFMGRFKIIVQLTG